MVRETKAEITPEQYIARIARHRANLEFYSASLKRAENDRVAHWYSLRVLLEQRALERAREATVALKEAPCDP